MDWNFADSRLDWFEIFTRRVVCFLSQTELESSEFRVCSSVVGIVRANRACSMAGLAAVGLHGGKWCPGALLVPIIPECPMVVSFFGLHRPDLAFIDVVALLLAILMNVLTFRRVSKPAGLLMLPYLFWVGFASVLNLQIWRLN